MESARLRFAAGINIALDSQVSTRRPLVKDALYALASTFKRLERKTAEDFHHDDFAALSINLTVVHICVGDLPDRQKAIHSFKSFPPSYILSSVDEINMMSISRDSDVWIRDDVIEIFQDVHISPWLHRYLETKFIKSQTTSSICARNGLRLILSIKR